MKLYQIEYVSSVSLYIGAIYERWLEDNRQKQNNSMIYSLSSGNGLIIEQLKGDLHYGGIDNSIAIDSCFF